MQPVVVVLLQRNQQVDVRKVKHREVSGVDKLGVEPINILVDVSLRTVNKSLAHPGITAGKKTDQFRIIHVRNVWLVPLLALKGFITRQAGSRHPHLRNIDALRAARWHHNTIRGIANRHNPRGLVTKAVRKPGKYRAPFHHV